MAEITEKSFKLTPSGDIVCKVLATAQHDYFRLTGKDKIDLKGVLIYSARAITGAVASILRGTVAVNNAGTAYTANSLSIAYDTASLNRSVSSFYIQTASGEIMEVIDTTPNDVAGTLTVLKRGALGTTPSAVGLADNAILYVLNVIQLEDAVVSPTIVIVRELPYDSATGMFA